ncbi:MAG TPA: glycine zipper 2TM domain-containing protein [Gemmatimonadaceae bacterium]|nr:glycine zipper 2TM domain-containing protein [Gemmatimonadaceae bacterium]
MTTQLRTSVMVFALAILGATACGDETPTKRSGAGDVLAQDTTLDLNIALANEDSLSEAQLNDVTPSATPAETSSAASTSSGNSGNAEAAGGPTVSDKPVVRRNRARRVASKPASARRVVPVSRTTRRAVAQSATRRVSAARRARTAAAVAAAERSRVATSRRRSEAQAAASRSSETSAIASANVARGTSRSTGERTETTRRRPMGVIAAGSELSLEAAQRVCTNTSNVGDRFEARLAESVTAANGTVIPRGATATGEVSSVRKNGDDDSALGFRLSSLSFAGRTYALNSEVTYAEMSTVRSQSRSGTASKVAIGAGAGAVLGRVLGRNTKSTVIGAVGGAAAGAVLASRTNTVTRCVPDGGRITARLTEPLTIGLSE